MSALLATLPAAAEPGLASRLELLEAPAPWVLVLVILPLVLGVVWLQYGARLRDSWPHRVLGLLRGLTLLAVLLVLARPARVEERQEVRPAEVAILVDDSASMGRVDPWTGDADGRAALERATGLDPRSASRAQLAAAGVARSLTAAPDGPLARGGYTTHAYDFAEDWTPRDPEGLATPGAASGAATHLGDAVLGVLGASAARHLTDLVVVTDGRSTAGAPVVDAARRAAAAGVPVHTVLVGDARPERGLALELVDAPETVLADDEIAVRVRLVGEGLGDAAPEVSVRLEELDAEGQASGRVLDEEARVPGTDGERLLLVAPPNEAAGATTRHFLVRAPVLDGETRTDDNTLRLSVRVSDERIRVLYVEGRPRWEYRFLKEFLKRSDANVLVQCYLCSATADFPQEASRELEPLRRLPATRQELLDAYDVVVLGDVNPYKMGASQADSEAFLAALVEFVEAGGGLCFQAGEVDNPRAFAGTPLEALLPVVLDPAGRAGFAAAEEPFRPRLENPGLPHEVVSLASDPEVNRRLFEDEGGLAGLYWFHPVERAKPGATVLLRHPYEENRHGRRPLLVAGHHPEGRTLFLAFDSTWRWNWREMGVYRERFWKGALRWLARGRLKSGDRRHQLEPQRSAFALDEPVVIEARVLDQDWRPTARPRQEVRWSGPDGAVHEEQLEAVPGRPGSFRGHLEVERPGPHRAWIEEEGRERAGAGFEVTLPSREGADPSPDPDALRELSALTGGRAVTLGSIADLADEFPGDEERREPVSARFDDVWDRWSTLLLVLALLSAEWVLRKRLDLA